jgi:hypothetical protein
VIVLIIKDKNFTGMSYQSTVCEWNCILYSLIPHPRREFKVGRLNVVNNRRVRKWVLHYRTVADVHLRRVFIACVKIIPVRIKNIRVIASNIRFLQVIHVEIKL